MTTAAALGLNRQHQAGADRGAVDNDRARAAHAMLAAEMGAGLPQLVAQAIGEMHSRLDIDLDWLAVKLEHHTHHAPRCLCRGAQAALDKRCDEGTAIGGTGMQILRRVDRLRRGCRRLADQVFVDGAAVQQCLHFSQPLRPIASADHTDMGVAHPAGLILVIKQGDAGKREIALPLSEFLKGPAPIRRARTAGAVR